MTPTGRLLTALGLAAPLAAGAIAWSFRSAAEPAVPDDAAAPVVLVAEQTEWDFGPVRRESDPLAHTFTLLNRGAMPITLKLRRVGCGCMSVRCPDSVPAGSSAVVEVAINPRSKSGPFSGPAEIDTSDPTSPTINFRVRADSIPPCALVPDALEFLDVEAGQTPQREFAVVVRQEPDAPEPAAPRLESASPALTASTAAASRTANRPASAASRTASPSDSMPMPG